MKKGKNVKKVERPKEFKGAWCELRNKFCIHPAPDDLDNCRACSEYDFMIYMDGIRKCKFI